MDGTALHLATIEYGKTLVLAVRFSAWTPLYFDVETAEDGTSILFDEPTQDPASGSGMGSVKLIVIDTSASAWSSAEVGRYYQILVKSGTGGSPANSTVMNLYLAPAATDQLRRLVAFAGENLVVDSFTFDDAGNPTGYRLRLFDTAANASTATLGEASMEPGEVARYAVTQAFESPTSRRSSHRSTLDTLALDG